MIKTLITNTLTIVALTVGMFLFFDWALYAHEHEECHQMRSIAAQGHNLIVPDWCDQYFEEGE